MRRILCFGDSNTWGYNPSNSTRWGEGIRWTSRLHGHLNSQCDVPSTIIEEGLNGRTTVWDDASKPYRNGSAALPMLLTSHRPLDWVVIMLGTNDLKSLFPADTFWIGEGLKTLIGQVKSADNAGSPIPRILVVSPPPMHEGLVGFPQGREKSLQLADVYRQIAKEEGCVFFDAGTVCEASPIDGLHLDEAGHAALAKGIATALNNA